MGVLWRWIRHTAKRLVGFRDAPLHQATGAGKAANHPVSHTGPAPRVEMQPHAADSERHEDQSTTPVVENAAYVVTQAKPMPRWIEVENYIQPELAWLLELIQAESGRRPRNKPAETLKEPQHLLPSDPEIPAADHPLPLPAGMALPIAVNVPDDAAAARIPECPVEHILVVGDTEGDVCTLKRNLALLGIVDGQGGVNAELLHGRRMALLDEGDAIRKQAPDGAYFKYMRELDRETPDTFHTISLAGNHELERLSAGLTKSQAKIIQGRGFSSSWLLGVIRGMDIFHLAAPMLYLHGYPTIEFMRLLWREFVARGNHAELLNERFRNAICKGGRHIDDWRYKRGVQKNHLLYDVGDAVQYFATHGKEMVSICRQLGVHTIVIGHRPCTTGMQEVMVLPGSNGKKANKEAARLHDALIDRIHRGRPVSVEHEWPNKGVVVLRNDVLGKGNHNRYGMLLIRKTGERFDMLAVNARHHDSQRTQAFMGMEDAAVRDGDEHHHQVQAHGCAAQPSLQDISL